MISFFKNKKQTSAPVSQDSSEKMSNKDVLETINRMQRELDRLKLTITQGNYEAEDFDADRIVEETLAEIQKDPGSVKKSEAEKIVEGVFDGEKMIGADGEHYDVPANYASKSKLVEGDILKLTINNLGSFVYKQIKPIERQRKVGQLEQDDQNLQYYAVLDGKRWKLLTASVTYYKGEEGDEIVFLIPTSGSSRWAAVENIVKS